MKPTHIRYLIVGIAMLAAVLLYLERVCVSVAEVYIREDLRIGKVEMDLAFGAFFIAYALGQVPSGWLSQRYGPRAMLTAYMLGWSLFGVFIALSQDFYTLFAARFLLGLSQAGAYPTAALLVKRWIPDAQRGLASSVVAFGGRLGGAGSNWLTGILIVALVPISTPATIAPTDVLDPPGFTANLTNKPPAELLAIRARVQEQVTPTAHLDAVLISKLLNGVIQSPDPFPGIDLSGLKLSTDARDILAKPVDQRSQAERERLNRLVIEKAFPNVIRQLHTDGWRPTLMLYGVGGLVVGGLFWGLARNWPRDHPWANSAEVAIIEAGQTNATEGPTTNAIPIVELLASRNQWLFSINQFFSNFGWVFLITLMPRFLSERFGVPIEQRGLMTTVPLFVAAVSMIGAGWFTDRLTRARGRRWGRAIPLGAFKLPCAVMLVVSTGLDDAWSVVMALTVMAVCQDFGIPSAWAFAQDTGGKQAATVLGWGNMWGNFGAGMAPPLLSLIEKHAGWDPALWTGATAFVFCGVAGILTNANEMLFRKS